MREVAGRVCCPLLVKVAVVVHRLGLGAAAITDEVAAATVRVRVCKVSAANEHTRCAGFLGH